MSHIAKKKQLMEAIEAFKTETEHIFEEGSTLPATKHDMNELARQTYYALDAINQALQKLL